MNLVTRLKSKIENITVTETNLNYEGSISIQKDLLYRANITPYEQVHVLNLNTGGRFVTYAIAGDDKGIIINGALAREFQVGDKIIILTYIQTDTAYMPYQPVVINGEVNDI
jgi:aspartate 1-decarboxylase